MKLSTMFKSESKITVKKITSNLFSLFFLIVLIALAFQSSIGKEIILNQNSENSLKVLNNTYESLGLKILVSKLDVFDVNTSAGVFSQISGNGDYTYTEQIGRPKLPVIRKLIEIPIGATIEINTNNSQFTEYSLSVLGIEHPIIPAQAPIAKNQTESKEFKYNQKFYTLDSYYPQNLAQSEILGIMRGIRVARINIFPIQYNPKTNKIRIYTDININITFPNANVAATLDLKKKTNSFMFNTAYRQIINYKSLEFEAPTHGIKDKDKILNGTDPLTRYPLKYVIVSNPMFQTALQSFIEWKKKKGFHVIEAYTNQPEVGNTDISIKAYLQNLYESGTTEDPAPTFILLVGDVDQLPAHSYGDQVGDIWYAEYTGDLLPELYYGRFSATTVSELQPQIDKTLEYERYLMPDPSFLNEAVMVAGMDDNFGPLHANGQINYGTDYYFNTAHGITSHTYLYPASGGQSTQIHQDVSNGVCFANYTAHGGPGGWASPSFSVDDVPALTNNHKYPLMVGNCCLSNKFDDPVCFGEALLRAENKGALGYIGGSNVTYWDEDYYWGVGAKPVVVNPTYLSTGLGSYDRTFHDNGEPAIDWYITQAEMVVAGNLAVTQGAPGSATYYWQVYNLMGDPSLMVYFSEPAAGVHSYSPIIPIGSTQFTVNTEPRAFVSISRDGIIHGTELADTNGVALITIQPFLTPGHASIVITKQNMQPFIDSVMVASIEGPYLSVCGTIINDLSGNNNNQIDFGETITLGVNIGNFGLSSADSVNIILTSEDSYVNIINNNYFYGNISSLDTVLINNFSFTVAGNVPNLHRMIFHIIMTDISNTWESIISLTAHAPQLSVTGPTVTEIQGNNNNRIDPGESGHLTFVLHNLGSAQATGININLTTQDPYISLNNSSQFLDSINQNSNSSNISFIINTSTSTPLGHIAQFQVQVTANGGITLIYPCQIIIGKITALIIDLDPNVTSGNTIQSTIQSLNFSNEYSLTIPDNLDRFSSIFICLGIWPQNHVLTESESVPLTAFLNSGGKIFMEGGDTWAYDGRTTLHPYFKITGLADGTNDLGTVNGITGTLGAGLSFSYNGENSYMDHINSESPAVTIFQNQSPFYYTAVAHDAGTYKTIGTSFEFSGLVDGNFPSTKQELMYKILNFFGLIPVPSQSIYFSQGWNLVSSFIQPTNSLLTSFISQLSPNLLLMKNPVGEVYWPAWGINNIISWNIRHAYLMYLTIPDTLTLTGTYLNPVTTTYPMTSGWKSVSYIRRTSMTPLIAFATIAEHLVLAKDGLGNTYYPGWGIDDIQNLYPGQGYQINLNGTDTLIYPANPPVLKTGSTYATSLRTQFMFPTYTKTGSDATLLIEAPDYPDGTEIAVITPDGIIAGTGAIKDSHVIITVWGDDINSNNIKEGFSENEALNLIIYETNKSIMKEIKSENIISDVTFLYSNNSIIHLKLKRENDDMNSNNSIKINPNPASERLTLEYNLMGENSIKLRIINNSGLEVYNSNLLNSNKSEINIESLPAGYYTCDISNGNESISGGFIKLK